MVRLKEAPDSFHIHKSFKLIGVLSRKTQCFCISVRLLVYQRPILTENDHS